VCQAGCTDCAPCKARVKAILKRARKERLRGKSTQRKPGS
jgi:hypothetical protein